MLTHKTHVISRKILMTKSKDRKCYMYLKFHINPSYIVYVINCILTHAFFFFREYIIVIGSDVLTSVHDKRDDFGFLIFNFPGTEVMFLDSHLMVFLEILFKANANEINLKACAHSFKRFTSWLLKFL